MVNKMKISTLFVLSLLCATHVLADKKKVAQSGMTYLGISMGARETAMGDASVASSKGIQGAWHNPAVLADIPRFEFVFNQVSWLVETNLYGIGVAWSLNNWGTISADLSYMDFGEIIGTRRVDKSVDIRGFQLTGDIGVEDYAIGLAYAKRFHDKFALGFKIKILHESLGNARYVIAEFDDPESGEKIRDYDSKLWKLNSWGLDFGTIYHTGWHSLAFAMALQNFSPDMRYWYEEFTIPMVLRMGLAMDMTDLWPNSFKDMDINMAVDVLHPNDYTERIHIGSEFVYKNSIALRGGYKFNHDVESLTFGLGVNFRVGRLNGTLDYAQVLANYFSNIHRFSFLFSF